MQAGPTFGDALAEASGVGSGLGDRSSSTIAAVGTVIGDHGRREKARELEPAVPVGRAHDGDLDVLSLHDDADVVHPLKRHVR